MGNKFENHLGNVTEIVASTFEFTNNTSVKSQVTPISIRRKMRIQRRLITALRAAPNNHYRQDYKILILK